MAYFNDYSLRAHCVQRGAWPSAHCGDTAAATSPALVRYTKYILELK